MEELYNINVERSVLSTIIFDPEIYEEIVFLLKSEDFYLPFHQYLLSAMESLFEQELPIDEEFLRKELLKQDKFDEVAMVDVLSANPITNTKAYVQEIKAYSNKRQLITLATQIKKLTIEDDLNVIDIMDRVEQKLYKITQDSVSEDFKDSKRITVDMLNEIERLKALGNSKLIGVDTGFENLNDKTSGFGKGDLVIIAARPAMGKTAIVLNMALKAIQRGEGVAFFSLEMPAEQLMLRMLAAETGIPLQALRVGNLQDEEWTQLTKAVDDMSRRRLFVDDGGYATIHHVRSKLRKLKSQHPEISMAIIDYLQLMSGENKSQAGRQQEISEISRGLKQLARELEIPILALSQLNRSLENRDNKRPQLSDIRESGAIEQDADIILFVYRDAIYEESKIKEKLERAKSEDSKDLIQKYEEKLLELKRKEQDETELIIGKQRNGPTGTVDLLFQKRFTRFVDANSDKYSFPVEHVYDKGDYHMTEGKIDAPII